MFKKNILLILGVMLSCQVHAAGYQIQEYSVVGLGRAFAGASLIGDDYSALAYNPAGMQQNKQSGLQLGVTGIDVRTTLYGRSKSSAYPHEPESSSNHTFTRLFRLMPNAFGQYCINDKAVFGAGLYVPYGLATDYDNHWYGKVHGLYSGITVVDFTPAISYQVFKNWTLGLGINLQYAVAHLTGGLPLGGNSNLRGDDFGVGGTIGIVWQPQKSTKFGLSYRSEVKHKLEGNNKISGADTVHTGIYNGKTSVSAKITTPETVQFSLAQDLGQKWTLSGLARWTRWSRFNTLNIVSKNSGAIISSTKENWRDTWFLSMGADYRLSQNITLRLGSAYDQSAVRRPKYRTPRIPDARRLWVSGGLSYQKNNWQIDLAYAHLFIKRAHAFGTAIDKDNVSRFEGHYDSKSDIAGLQFQYKF